jgi:hypothetical protein
MVVGIVWQWVALGMVVEILFAALALWVGQKDWNVQPDPLAHFPCAKGERPKF